MTTQTLPAATAATLRPLRLNFAQVCIWCATRWCESPRCIAMHERSAWIVCDQCDGFGSKADSLSACLCTHGLIEATRAGVEDEADRVLPLRPADLDEPAGAVTALPVTTWL